MLIRAMLLVVFSAESSHCAAVQNWVFIKIPASQKKQQTIDMRRYMEEKTASALKKKKKLK